MDYEPLRPTVLEMSLDNPSTKHAMPSLHSVFVCGYELGHTLRSLSMLLEGSEVEQFSFADWAGQANEVQCASSVLSICSPSSIDYSIDGNKEEHAGQSDADDETYLHPQFTDADRRANAKGKRILENSLLHLNDVQIAKYLSNFSVNPLYGVRAWLTSRTPKYVVDAVEARYAALNASDGNIEEVAVTSDVGGDTFLYPQYTDADRARRPNGKLVLEEHLSHAKLNKQQITGHLRTLALNAIHGVRAWTTTQTPRCVVDAVELRYNELVAQESAVIDPLWLADKRFKVVGGLLGQKETDPYSPAGCVSTTGDTGKNTKDAVSPGKTKAVKNSQSVKFMWSEFTDADREKKPRGKRTLHDHLLKMTDQQIDEHLSNFSLDALDGVCAWVTTATPQHVVDAINKRYQNAHPSANKVEFLWSEYTNADRAANPKGKRMLQDSLLCMTKQQVLKQLKAASFKVLNGVCAWATTRTPKHIVDALDERYGELKGPSNKQSSESVVFLWPEYTNGDRAANPKGKRTLRDHLLKMTDQQIDKHLRNFSLDSLDGVCAWVTTATPQHVVDAINKRYQNAHPSANKVEFLWPEYTNADRAANPKGKGTLKDHLLHMTGSQITKYISSFSLNVLNGVCAWATTRTPKHIVDALDERYKKVC